jgi:pimeloyl-ACP methyl ester carboxylesterase
MKPWQKIMLSVFLFLLAALLIGPFLIPVPPLTDTLSEKQLADPDSKFIEINGVTVHYKEMGQGQPVAILLHGFGASVFSWHTVMEPFSQMGRVIAYDRPAFGLTSRPMLGEWTGESPYSLAANVELLSALMQALGVEKATLIGNSAGGGVAVAFALKYPEQVAALILVDPAVGNGGRFPAWALPLMAAPQLRHLGPLLVRNIATSGNDTIRLAWHDPAKITPEVFAGYRKPLKAHNWDRALYEFTIAARSAGLSDRLAELKMPVLVITGDDDRIVPTQSSIDLAGKIPGAALVVIPACGHVPHEECPDRFMESVRNFLK